MKKALLPTICILLCTLCIVFVPTEAEAAIYDDTLRLHILAPSDSVSDQMLKLEIRDKILSKYGYIMQKSANFNDAKSNISALTEMIEADCNEWIRDMGYEYYAKAELVMEWYNTREYSCFILPAGNYLSLKITLGQGEGQNWWCVMYPPMCLDAAIGDEVYYSDEEQNLIANDKYRVKFKLLEATSEVFKGRR